MPDISHYVKKTFAILSGFMGLSLSKKPDKNRPYQSIRMFDRRHRMPGLYVLQVSDILSRSGENIRVQHPIEIYAELLKNDGCCA